MSNAAVAYDAAPVQQIDAGDATLAYRRFGSGPSLLFVHGFPLHGFTWRHLLPLLASRFTCHVVDSAGKGSSTWRPETDFEFTGHARRLKTIADRLGLERYGVVAQDTGATVARCLALADPQRVERLVLINTEIPGHRPPWIVQYQYLMRSRAFLRSGMGFGGCFANLDLIDGEFHARFVAPYIASAEKTDGMARYLVGLHWPIVDDFARRHAELRMPVLLVWGEDDPTFPIERARGMIPQFADCRGLTPVAGTKLLPHEEKPAEVAAIVQEFCS